MDLQGLNNFGHLGADAIMKELEQLAQQHSVIYHLVALHTTCTIVSNDLCNKHFLLVDTFQLFSNQ